MYSKQIWSKCSESIGLFAWVTLPFYQFLSSTILTLLWILWFTCWNGWIYVNISNVRFHLRLILSIFCFRNVFYCSIILWLHDCCASSHLKCVTTIKSIHLLSLQHYRTTKWIHIHVISISTICLDEMKTNHSSKMQISIKNVYAARTRLSQNVA